MKTMSSEGGPTFLERISARSLSWKSEVGEWVQVFVKTPLPHSTWGLVISKTAAYPYRRDGKVIATGYNFVVRIQTLTGTREVKRQRMIPFDERL